MHAANENINQLFPFDLTLTPVPNVPVHHLEKRDVYSVIAREPTITYGNIATVVWEAWNTRTAYPTSLRAKSSKGLAGEAKNWECQLVSKNFV